MWICSKTWDIPITQMSLPSGTVPNTLSIPAALTGITYLSSLHRVGRHPQPVDTTGPFPLNFVCLTIALNNPEEKQCILSCPSVRDSHKYLFQEWKIQILQSQMVPKTNYQLIEEGSGFPFAVAAPL